MVTANNKFPIRVGTQKIAAGVPEIRRLFSGSQEFQHAYERFRVRRIEKALNVYRLPAPSLLIHYVPLTAFDLENEYPVIDKIDTLQAPVFGYTAANPLINVDGIINRAKSEEAGFTQIFRNGIIELGTSNVFFRDETRSNPPVEMSLVEFATLITANLEIQLKNYKRLSMQDPFYLIVNLIGVNGVHGDVQQRNRHYTAIQLDDDFIQLPELWLDPEAGVDPTADLRPLLRTLWNAFGMDHAI